MSPQQLSRALDIDLGYQTDFSRTATAQLIESHPELSEHDAQKVIDLSEQIISEACRLAELVASHKTNSVQANRKLRQRFSLYSQVEQPTRNRLWNLQMMSALS